MVINCSYWSYIFLQVWDENFTVIGKVIYGADIAGTSSILVSSVGTGVVPLPVLTVYEVGLGTGTVTSNPVGINCTSGAGCSGNFVAGTAVTLTAVPSAGSTFGGWSSNCLPDTAATTSCTIVMNNNEPVGAIFNQAP
jgi:Divergent InlB B-repeat domain